MKLINLLRNIVLMSAIVCIGCTNPSSDNESDVRIILLSSSVTVSHMADEHVVTFVAADPWEATTAYDWIAFDKKAGTPGMCEFKFKVHLNLAEEEREGSIVFKSLFDNSIATFEVKQAPNSIAKARKWAEIPTMPAGTNLEYYAHDILPSNPNLRNYSFCFDKEKHCALWVAYPLHRCYTEGDGNRTDAWRYDPCCVDDVYEPNLRGAYYPQGGASNNSHSRGHQLPSADRLASNADNATTFYYTNMTPQLQSLNSGAWETLEGDLRKKWMCSDTLYVVTGAHFADGYGYAYDDMGGGKACAVPTHYYKVILRTKKGNSGKWVGNCSANELKCVGFWFEHKDKASRQTMSVAEIERKTGHTFFPNVPNAPKSTYNASEW